jgi:tetratricopeptide (TPR) repeat protein
LLRIVDLAFYLRDDTLKSKVLNKKRVSQTKATSLPKPRFFAKLRQRALIGLCVALLVAFFYRGGVSGFSTSMAKNALISLDTASADRWLSITTSLSSKTAEIEYLLAKKARLNRKFVEMSDHLRAALKGGFDSEILEREQILANVSVGEMDPLSEAKVKLWIASKSPDIGDVVDSYANGLATLSRFDDAGKVLEQYETIYPNDAMVNFRMGIMNEHIRATDKAEKEYRLALAKDPKHIRAAWRVARIESNKNAPEEAIKILNAFDNGQQSLAIKTFLGHCYQQLGDFDKSREYFKMAVEKGHSACLESYRAIDETPERFLAASDLGILEASLGNWDDAKKYLELALKENPKDFIARNSYGQVLRRLGQTEQADDEFKRIRLEREEFDRLTVLRDKISQSPSDTAARVEMGRILFKYESERFGLFWIRSALTYDPSCQDAHQFLAEYYTDKYKQEKNDLYRTKADAHRSYLRTTTSISK